MKSWRHKLNDMTLKAHNFAWEVQVGFTSLLD